MAERGYRNLNTSVLKQISRALEPDSAADIEPVLNKVSTLYASLRQKIGKRQEKRRQGGSKGGHQDSNPPLKPCKPSMPYVLVPFVSAIQWQPNPTELSLLGQWPLPRPNTLSCSLPHCVLFPLSPVVCEILGRDLDLSTLVLRCVFSSVPIWEGQSRAVFQVGENVAVKVAQDLDQDEHGILLFLEQRVPNIAAPRALGMITVGSTTFMFMTMIPGATLESRWPSLSTKAKTHVRCVLDKNLIALRKLELSQGEPFGSPVGRRVSKDFRRHVRFSATPIYSETQFNDFLLNSPTSRAASGYKDWLRSILRVDHRVVFSHADFHPRNIMVVDGLDGMIELSGIIDWEASGFYPEYWDQLKAMNMRSTKDTSDWWEYLPTSILGYDHEVVLNQVIESTMY